MTKGPFVAKLNLKLAPRLEKELDAQGFEMSQPPYTLFAAKKPGLSCTLYKSGKLVVQGKQSGEFIEFYLEPEILGTFTHGQKAEVDLTPRIGTDEAGKGDYYGSLCIAGVYADEKMIERLAELGVRDSKKLRDPQIISMAREIIKICPYHILRLRPAKYNELYASFGNLNHLMAWGHASVIETLVEKTKCQNVIVDKFAHESLVEKAVRKKGVVVSLTQRVRAESDLVVAAASMLARAAFVRDLERLEKEVGIELPKGATSAKIPINGRKVVAQHGREALGLVAKLHFRTTQKILGS